MITMDSTADYTQLVFFHLALLTICSALALLAKTAVCSTDKRVGRVASKSQVHLGKQTQPEPAAVLTASSQAPLLCGGEPVDAPGTVVPNGLIPAAQDEPQCDAPLTPSK